MTTKTSLDMGSSNFAETMIMNTENEFAVKQYDNSGGDNMSIVIKFTHLDVVTKDTGGDFAYYNSYEDNGNTDFDEVLKNMIGQTATVSILGMNNYFSIHPDA